MKCLSCNDQMINHFVQTWNNRISYDICEACGSLWLDAGELDKMAFQVSGSIEYCSRHEAQDISKSTKVCPRCENTTLDNVIFIGHSDIILDRCRNCGGFWLDGGELDLINKELTSIMPVEGKGFSKFVNNVHLPYWYKRVIKKSGETDFRIEVPPLKNAKLKAATTNKCPACGTNLNLYTIYSIEIDGCPSCKGSFFDSDELRKLKDRSKKGAWRTLRWMDDEYEAIRKANAMSSNRVCPKCEVGRMISTSFGDSVIIDWCPSCHGTWLDRDEFDEIVKCLSSKLDKLSPADMKQKCYEEIKEIWDGPEHIVSEILDAKAAISALINITIFDSPALCKTLMKV